MPEKNGTYSGNSKTSIIAAIIFGLILIVGAGAIIFSSHDDLFDDGLDSAVKFGKIAVACDGKNLKSYVSPVFSRAKYFLIVDPKTGEYKAIRNPFRNLDGAAGSRVAQLVAKEIDDGVITGDIGPNAYNVLTGSGLKVYTGYRGTSGNAVKNYKNQKIAEAKNAQYHGSNIAGVMNYFHCRNCNTVVPCPYGHNGAGGNSPFCPSCGLKMRIVTNNPAGMSGPNMYGAGGFGQGLGTVGYLVCPTCGNTTPHQNGVPAYSVNCPKCGTVMRKQRPAFLPTAFNNNSTQNSFSQFRNQTYAPPITTNAIMPHEYRGVCSNCHQITKFNNRTGTYQSGGYSYNNAARPYRLGPGGSIIR